MVAHCSVVSASMVTVIQFPVLVFVIVVGKVLLVNKVSSLIQEYVQCHCNCTNISSRML